MKLYAITLPYLLLVSFTIGPMRDLDLNKVQQINRFPYQGVAAPLIKPHDAGKYDERDFDRTRRLLNEHARKDVWPWVFMKRFMASPPGGKKPPAEAAGSEYFARIRGMDLFDQTGALGDFFNLWGIALRLAKKTGAPGVVLDHEAYGNPQAYRLDYLVRETGHPKEELRSRLKQVGARMLDLADEAYPEAVIWCLATGLGRVSRRPLSLAGPEPRTITYIIMGLLERAKEKGSRVKVVSGGEMSLFYCYESLADLKASIEKRNNNFAPALAAYPNLRLGGCIAPWYDANLRGGWMRQGKCGRSVLKTMADFKPLIAELLHSYQYVWVYAAGMAPYAPFEENNAVHYHGAISEVMQHFQGSKGAVH